MPTSRRSRTSVVAPRRVSTTGRERSARRVVVQGVRRLLELRAAAVPAVPGPDEEEGRVQCEIYLKRNFLAGGRFRDTLDFNEQLHEWMATVDDARVHGTTHERPIDRFAQERDAGGPSIPARGAAQRVVATDYLVSVDTNCYSVSFTLIGQPVEVMRRDGLLQMRHRGQVVATHPVRGGRHQLRSLPEHGPGQIARNGCSTAARSAATGGLGEGTVVCRLPRRTAERRGVREDRQARHDGKELGSVPVHQGATTFTTAQALMAALVKAHRDDRPQPYGVTTSSLPCHPGGHCCAHLFTRVPHWVADRPNVAIGHRRRPVPE